ncbi:protein phosphatase 2C domain-containing protein [Streptomyces sp. NPDC091259]|uniref:protein phosphatase 2C domain-containing protein n=1 Tax=Streptomyces sp. NPDC091259 TaxID=3365976 RepID=UPI00380015EE
MSMHRLSGCPSCAEPLEEGDRFCGVCGYAVSAARDDSAGPAAPGPDRGGHLAAEVPAGGVPFGATVSEHGSAGADPGEGGHPAPVGSPGPNGPSPTGPGRTAPRGAVAPDGPTVAASGGYDAPLRGLADRPEAAEGGHPGVDPGQRGPAGEHPAQPVQASASGMGRPYPDHPEATAPAGGSGSAVPAPGWGSVTSAAPTLVDDAGDWSAAPAEQGGAASWQSTPAQGPAYDDPGGSDPAHEPQYEAAHAPAYEPALGDGPARESAYDPPQGDDKTCVACRAGRVDTDGYCEHCGHAQPRERDHLEEELGSVAAVSDRGLRHHRNEDSFAVAATALPDGSAATVAIVCDGVSSASRPDEASAAAAGAANEALLEALPRGAHPQEAMHEAILAAAAAVNALAPEVPGAQNAPACTLVGAVVSGGVLTIGWVGDSRAYWVPDDRAALPRRLTEDDSWAAQMVAAGLMGEAEAYADVRAHAITGWLGADAYDLEPHTASFKPDHPGVVVVCTDGLWNYAESAREMAQVLPPDAASRPLHSAQVLVGHALDGGGHDNVTVAVVPFASDGPQPVAHAQPEPEAEPRPQA